MHDIIDTAAAAGTFKTLATAVTAAGLVDTLKGKGPFTVFAPTDAAFAKLPPGTVEALLKDIPKLKALLTYHVVAGKVTEADALKMDGKGQKTVNGADLKITTAGGLTLNGTAHVAKGDIDCTNGVIHPLDAVVMPPDALRIEAPGGRAVASAHVAEVASACSTTCRKRRARSMPSRLSSPSNIALAPSSVSFRSPAVRRRGRACSGASRPGLTTCSLTRVCAPSCVLARSPTLARSAEAP